MNNTLDYKQFIEDHFFIVNKNEQSVPFIFNSVQSQLYNSMCGRDIVLKARQEGVSSLVLALFTVDFLLSENSRSVCIAHDKDSTVKLFERVKYFIGCFEQIAGTKVQMIYNTRSEIVNESNNAHFYVGTAGSESFGRGATLTNVHFSEIAFYRDAQKIYLSASQAGTPKRIILESTANGVGDFFYKFWNDAKEGKSNFAPHFFGWQDHHEYKAPDTVKIILTTEEKELKQLYTVTDQQLAWRRQKITEFPTKEAFKQEYPMTPEEAFISSGNPVLDMEALRLYKQKDFYVRPPLIQGDLVGIKPPVMQPSESGYLKVWKKPTPSGIYIIGADIAEGIKDGDFSCAQVLDRRSFEQVAVWHGRKDPDIFGRELNRIGYYYNQALLAPERNNMGIAVVLVLRELDYPNIYIREKVGEITDTLTPEIGWRTDTKTRPMLIADLQKVIREKSLILHDEHTVMELLSFQYDEGGHAQASQGSYDDRVMALGIAVEMYMRTPYIEPLDTNKLQSLEMEQFAFDPLQEHNNDYGNSSSPDFSR